MAQANGAAAAALDRQMLFVSILSISAASLSDRDGVAGSLAVVVAYRQAAILRHTTLVSYILAKARHRYISQIALLKLLTRPRSARPWRPSTR